MFFFIEGLFTLSILTTWHYVRLLLFFFSTSFSSSDCPHYVTIDFCLLFMERSSSIGTCFLLRREKQSNNCLFQDAVRLKIYPVAARALYQHYWISIHLPELWVDLRSIKDLFRGKLRHYPVIVVYPSPTSNNQNWATDNQKINSGNWTVFILHCSATQTSFNLCLCTSGI